MDFKIKLFLDSNPNYKNYLRSNSYWYKTLIRDPSSFNLFINEVKEKYKLRTTDKINNVSKLINLIGDK